MILVDNFLLNFGYFVLCALIAIFFLEILNNKKDIGDRILKRLFVAGASLFQGYFTVILFTSVMIEVDDYITQITNIPINYTNYTPIICVFGAVFYVIYMDRYFAYKQSFLANRNKASPREQIICDDLEQFVHSIKKEKKIIFFEYTDKVDSFGAQVSLVSNPIIIYLGKDLNERTTFSEKRFVIAHEMSHSLIFIRNLTIYLIIISISLVIIGDSHLINLENAIFFGIFQIFIFFILVLFVHYFLWEEEYRADIEGVKKTDDPQSAIDFFTRTLSYEKEIYGNEQEEDFGYFNLFLFDHPLTTNRKDKIQLSIK